MFFVTTNFIDMEVTGKIMENMEPKTGTSSHGKWKKQEIIIETEAKFNNKICLVNWNDKLDISNLNGNENFRCFLIFQAKNIITTGIRN